jgi:ankyrin repeat protein
MNQFAAARDGDLQQLQHLLTPDNVDKTNVYGSTALHCAARNGNVDCVKWCVEMRANVNVEDIFGSAPLHLASSNGFVDVVHVLLDSGANVDSRSLILETPLHRAISNNHVHVARVLIDRGAKISNVKLDEFFLSSIPGWVTAIVASRPNCQSASVAIIGIHKYHRTSITGNNDNNVLRLIGKHIWSSRMDDVWMANSKKINH